MRTDGINLEASFDHRGILLSLVHFPVLTLGPGRRLGIWTQGCSRRCHGCVSEHTWDFDETKRVNWDDVSNVLGKYVQKADGLTISGGEPLEQLPELLHLLEIAKEIGFDDILLYTGYTIEELQSLLGTKFERLKELVSVIVDGPYVSELRTEYIWKGSENQRMHILTTVPALVQRYEKFRNRKKDKKLQMVVSGGQIYIVGIP